MSSLQTTLEPLMQQLEEEGKNAKTLAELEQLVIKHSQRLAQSAFTELSEDLQERIFPPRERLP